MLQKPQNGSVKRLNKDILKASIILANVTILE